ncbi:hypothetical protein APHAL10511_001583 [Amanita phalloides]|nr:hypothetical protein APHAL10511_001583 [Amanita phalloides]
MSISIMSVMNGSTATNDEVCPDYDSATSSIRSGSSASHRRWLPQTPPPIDRQKSSAHRMPGPLQRNERYVYTYNLVAAGIPLQFLISVDPLSGYSTTGKYKFKLSIRTHGVERPLCEPTELGLSIDPRQLTFVVFVFPGKTKLTMGGLWCLRVWLRVNSIDHRLFGEDELWLGKDLDFASIPDITFARHRLTNAKEQIYTSPLGKAFVNFIVRWQIVSHGTYKYTLDYEAGGVSSTLFDDLELRLDHDPRHITFVIYTIPQNSLPAGAAHGLRVWLRSPLPSPDPAIPSSYTYQRVWKTDALKIGSRLNFDSLSSKVVMAHSRGGPETVISAESQILSPSLYGQSPAATLNGKESPPFRHQLYY